MRNITKQTRIVIIVGALAAVLFGSAFAYNAITAPEPADASETASLVLRPESHRLSAADDNKVTLVEFLDFECEACASAYPFIEQLREQYEGQVTFVARYFPIPSHRNALNAAYAVESAARQGKFEAMYKRMYETQAKWGESRDSKAPLFRTYADDLGLDMKQYDRDVESKDVAARVQMDVDDGTKLGVSGTPSFYLNGEPLIPTTTQEFVQAIETALAN